MLKRTFVFLLCWVFVIDAAQARFPNTPRSDSYIVVLTEPSLSRTMLDSRGGSVYKGIATRPKSHTERMTMRRERMEKRLGRFENRLKSLSPDIVPRRRFTGLINGLSINMPRNMASRVRSLPEVLSVVPNRRYKMSLTRSNDLMSVPLAWQLAGGQEIAGQGIKIGIIDTGIDNTHVMFDDSDFEMPEGYPLGNTDFTNNKIIVARVLTKSGDLPEDSTPRDRNGHGTHVASCAAGNSNTLSPLGLISGIAPRAYLGNYKVFTGEFTTLAQIVAALEAAVEDGMDVVNLSLGSEAFINTVLDPEAIAVRNAIKAGVVVVAAAGNSGGPETIGSPGQIPDVITVGSLTNSHNGASSAEFDIAMMNVYSDDRLIIEDEQVILGPDPDFFSRPLLGRFEILDADRIDGGRFGGDLGGLGCRSLPPGSAPDKWVLVQRGTCTFTQKIGHVRQAGGWGALVYNRRGAEEGPDEPLRSPSVGGTEIPSYFVSRNTGLVVKEALSGAEVVEVEFHASKPSERELTPFELSSFSSVGPSLEYGVKPEISAIGQGSYAATQNDLPGQFELNMFTVTSFDLSGFTFSSGTSFSSPRVAGVAALAKQVNPEWEPADVKSAIVTSGERVANLVPLSVMERGGGHIDTVRSMSVSLIATPSTLSWENVLIDKPTGLERTLRLENITDEFQGVTVSLALAGSESPQVVEVIPEQFDLAPRDGIDVSLKVEFSPPPGDFGSFEDINGDVVIELADESAGEELRVPVWARVINAPPVQGSVLLVDDDSGESIESQYVESIALAGHETTVWDVAELDAYPSTEYMQKFGAVSWFLASTSLFNIREGDTLNSNERIRFNVALTKCLARGGRLLVSGMDWSDGQEQTLFGQQVLHISEFIHDPFVQYTPTGEVASQERTLDISAVAGSPIGTNLPPLDATFNSDVANMSDILVPALSGTAEPALITNNDPEDVVAITVETESYRAVFFSFPLERVQPVPRVSRDGMDMIIQNSLDWLMSGPRKQLSIQSVEPVVQIDSSIPMTATLTVEGLNFSVGHDVRLNDTPVEITAIDASSGRIEIRVPAGLPEGIYDITLTSPDGRTDVLRAAFTIEDFTVPSSAR